MITLYGIPNCDKVKQARQWLDSHGLAYHFHNYKKDGIDAATLQRWISELGLDAIINRRGTTWRKLDETTRAALGPDNAIPLLQNETSLLTRPLLDTGREKILGFDSAQYQRLL